MNLKILRDEYIAKLADLSQFELADNFLIAFLIRQNEDFSALNAETVKKSIEKNSGLPARYFSAGVLLDYMYAKTQLEVYKEAVNLLYRNMRQLPRTKLNIFSLENKDRETTFLDIFAYTLPFYMIYEVRHNEKENINDLVKQLVSAEQFLFDDTKELFFADSHREKYSLKSQAGFLFALIETFDNSDEELFEHHQKIRNLFKKTLKSLLKHQDKENGLWTEDFSGSGEYCHIESLIIASSIYKGIRLLALQKDLYFEEAEKITQNVELRNPEDERVVLALEAAKYQRKLLIAKLRPIIKGGYKNV